MHTAVALRQGSGICLQLEAALDNKSLAYLYHNYLNQVLDDKIFLKIIAKISSRLKRRNLGFNKGKTVL